MYMYMYVLGRASETRTVYRARDTVLYVRKRGRYEWGGYDPPIIWQFGSLYLTILIVINPRRACAARVTVVVLCVCLSVRLSVRLFVHDYSRTTGYEAAYERYQHLQCHKGTKNKIAILLKRLRSRDMA